MTLLASCFEVRDLSLGLFMRRVYSGIALPSGDANCFSLYCFITIQKRDKHANELVLHYTDPASVSLQLIAMGDKD